MPTKKKIAKRWVPTCSRRRIHEKEVARPVEVEVEVVSGVVDAAGPRAPSSKDEETEPETETKHRRGRRQLGAPAVLA